MPSINLDCNEFSAEFRAMLDRWETGHVARGKINKAKRRERLRLARIKGTHTLAEWHCLMAEFAYRCVKCGRDGYYLDKDHIVPIYQGGSDGIDNIQPLCAWCNAGKGPDSFNWVAYRREHGMD